MINKKRVTFKASITQTNLKNYNILLTQTLSESESISIQECVKKCSDM